MTAQVATYFPQRVSTYVPAMSAHADVGDDSQCRVNLGSPVALDADGILAAQSINAAGSTTTFASTYSPTAMGTYGRRLSVIASGAATSTVQVRGRDYLNQPMSETLTLNGANTVVGVKAFKYIDQVIWGATSSVTIDLGWGSGLGLPFRAVTLEREIYDGGATSNAGTLTAGAAAATAQTATSADPRGIYLPHSSNLPNGTHTYELLMLVDKTSLHGAAHFYA